MRSASCDLVLIDHPSGMGLRGVEAALRTEDLSAFLTSLNQSELVGRPMYLIAVIQKLNGSPKKID
jgi:hypothetical protein